MTCTYMKIFRVYARLSDLEIVWGNSPPGARHPARAVTWENAAITSSLQIPRTHMAFGQDISDISGAIRKYENVLLEQTSSRNYFVEINIRNFVKEFYFTEHNKIHDLTNLDVITGRKHRSCYCMCTFLVTSWLLRDLKFSRRLV
jgi:hypothetical protein